MSSVTQVRPLWVMLKAIFLFILANIIFALWNPPVGKISLYNLIFPGRTRLPFGRGVVDYNITTDNVDAMIASHLISLPKQPDEYRVVILGDSAIWGELLNADQTISAQLNNLSMECSGKKVHFYNLGYPHPSVIKDLLLLDRVLPNKPDMIIWFITLNSLREKNLTGFLLTNTQRIQMLDRKYSLNEDHGTPVAPPTFFDRTLIGQRRQLSRLFLLQSFGALWSATGVDIEAASVYPALSNDQRHSLLFANLEKFVNLEPYLALDYIKTVESFNKDFPVLLVNDPMFIATGEHSDARYNEQYPRWAYDQYRQIMSDYTTENGWAYLDLWNAIPPVEFTDNPLHLSVAGEQLLARDLQPSIQKKLCP